MIEIDDLRYLVAKALTGLCLAHVPLLVVVAVALDRNSLTIGVAALIFAAVPTMFLALRRPAQVIAYALAIALIGQTALLVYALDGHPWQVEMHFYFFAVLAMLAGFFDSTLLITAAGLIAVHHLALNGLIPDALYPGGGDLRRLSVHVVIVVVETAMLVIVARLIEAGFEASFTEASNATQAASRLADMGSVLKEQLGTTAKRADHMEASLAEFRAEIGESLKRLIEASHSLDATADDFSLAIAQTTSQTRAVAVTAGHVNQRVGDVASSGRAYFETMSAISEHTMSSARMGHAALSEAEATVETIDELTLISHTIDAATKLIAVIAGQTNLLALNATIEAARAGEHGRGFSVVAAEVKTLAAETTKALATISHMVASIKGTTERSVAAIASIVDSIRGLNTATATIAEAVQERVFGAAHMSTNVDAAAEVVQKVTFAIEAIEGVTEESAKGAMSVRSAAREIAEQTEAIRQHVETFAADLIRRTKETAAHDGHAVVDRAASDAQYIRA